MSADTPLALLARQLDQSGAATSYALVSPDGSEVIQRALPGATPPAPETLALWLLNLLSATDDFYPDARVLLVTTQRRDLLILRFETAILLLLTDHPCELTATLDRVANALAGTSLRQDPRWDHHFGPGPRPRPVTVRGAGEVPPGEARYSGPGLPPEGSEPTPSPTPAPVATAAARGNPWPLVAVVLILMAGAVAFWVFRDQPTPPPAAPVAAGVETPPPPAAPEAPVFPPVEESIALAERMEAMAVGFEAERLALSSLATARAQRGEAERLRQEGRKNAAQAWAEVARQFGLTAVEAAQVGFQRTLDTLNLKGNPRQYTSPKWAEIDTLLAQSRQAEQAGDFAGATLLLRQAADQVPGLADDLRTQLAGMAEQAAKAGQNETAKYFYQEVLRLQPDHAAARSFLYRQAYPAGHLVANTLGLKLAYVPPGEFTMGSPEGESYRDRDEIQHTVTLTRGLFVGTTEITQGQWEAVMGGAAARLSRVAPDRPGFLGPNLPMVGITWKEAAEFCARLSRLEGRAYRLPTEAEWEYFCRAGSGTAYHNDRSLLAAQEARVYDPAGSVESPAPVASSGSANPWGLYDLHGNVWEWCADWSGPYAAAAATDPTGPADAEIQRVDVAMKVVRGGSWYDDPSKARSANRWEYAPSVATEYIGFRIVQEVTSFE